MVRMRSRAGMWAAALAVAGALGTGGVAQAATITVNQTTDGTGACPDTCTLRAAVASARTGDTVQLGAGAYTLTAGAPITVSQGITITGAGAAATTIDASGNANHRIFTVHAPLTLTGATLTGANDAADDQCPPGTSPCSTFLLTGGGAVFSDASLTLDDVHFTGDSASGLGGGLSSSGTLAMTRVEFSRDGAAFGGGLFVRGGTATVARSSFHDLGSSSFGGGAIFVYGGALSLTDSTVTGSGWASSRAGGIENLGGRLTLRGVTLADNVRGALETHAGATTDVGDTIIGAGFDDGGADYACVAANEPTDSGSNTGPAITIDSGHNLDEDGHCGLSATGDITGLGAHLAPLADNGGGTPTMALLHGSPALDAGAGCSLTDQRGTARPQGDACDIGAFEAVKAGTPTVSTSPASDIQASSATLNATVALQGEAGGAHFLYGTDPQNLDHTTPVGAAGVGPSASVPIDGLEPGTTYYFRAIADNATAASDPGDVAQFTTDTAPPVVSDVSVESTTDTTATISFSVDPAGEETTYVVKYGTDDLTHSTDPVSAGSAPGAKPVTVTLTGLAPDTTYQYEVVATNEQGDSPDQGTSQLTTERQVTAHPGGHVTVADSEDFGSCPQATIDWGDGSAPATVTPDCQDDGEDGVAVELTADHQYTAAGHYPITIGYGPEGPGPRIWAAISGTSQHVLTIIASGPGTVTGDGVECSRGTCLYDYDDGAPVSLDALPDNGQSKLVGWSGACDGDGTCELSMGQDETVTARFAGPPVLSDGVEIGPVTDTGAQLNLGVDPNGAGTSYVIEYGTSASYGQTYGPIALGSDPGAQNVSPTLTGLQPGTQYHFDVVATNAQGSTDSRDEVLTTEPQVSALTGQSVSIRDDFGVDGDCPSATIDWGDGSTSQADASCTGSAGTLTASHTYAAAGHFPIEIEYSNRPGSEQWALISAPQQATPTPTPSPTATPSPAPTATPTPPPTPVFHQQVVVRPVSGTVLVRRKGSKTFVPLDTKAGVPLGSQVDVTHGRIALTSVPKRGGKPETAQFYAGIFTVTQSGPVTVLTLSGPKPTCTARGTASAAAKKKKVKSRQLWGDGHGSFRTSGQYSAATVRGTQWLVQDTCAGTLTRVAHGLVAVTDRVRHKTVLVRGGKSYLARPRKH